MPSIALRLCPDDRTALREYLAFHRSHASAIAVPPRFPFVDAEVCRALLEHRWEPYLRELRDQATIGSGAGISYAEWFELAALHRKEVLAKLGDLPNLAPSRVTTLVRGMDRLLEIAVQTIGETYFALRDPNVLETVEHDRATLEKKSLAKLAFDRDQSRSSAARSRVLLVEDDLDLLRTLGRVLYRSGHDAVEVESGRQAIAALESESFDVIVSDIHMPDGGGLDLLRAVRRVDLDVPVILISGVPDVRSAAAALEYGAFRYIPKPLNLETLETTIRQARRAHAIARLRRHAVSAAGKHAGAADRAGLEVRFEQALGSLWIAFQPIFDATSGEIFGVEALLRSNEPSLPSPVAVLEAASNLGRGTALGRRIRTLAADRVMGHQHLQLFVNLQPEDLTDGDLIADTASLSKIATRVVLEVTERSALNTSAELASRISHLRELGFRIAVDDIGAGYSGLTSFTDLMPEIVKIDMALVRDIHLSEVKQRTVRALCNLCHEVGCVVIGEGVETHEERECVAALGCDLLQGFLLGRPHADLPIAGSNYVMEAAHG